MNQNKPAMKRTIRNLFIILIVFCVPAVVVAGQDKKNEKKIKVIVDEGSGSKTVLDTLLKGTPLPEKIELKDGTILYFGDPDMDIKHVPDGEKIIVTVDANDDGGKHVEKKVVVMSPDSAKWNMATTGDEGNVWVISRSKAITSSGSNTFSIVVNDDEDADLDTDATKYVIAKEGVVVTVQSDDEEKAKEILELIQGKLGVKSEGKE